MEDDKKFGLYLLDQKNNLEKIIESSEYFIDFDQALTILKEIVLGEYLSVEEINPNE